MQNTISKGNMTDLTQIATPIQVQTAPQPRNQGNSGNGNNGQGNPTTTATGNNGENITASQLAKSHKE